MPLTEATFQRFPPRGVGIWASLRRLATSYKLTGWPGIGIPGKHLLHYRGLDGVQPHPAGITGALGIEQIAIGGARPGQQLATAQLGLAPPSHALGNQGAFILGHGSANLQEQLIMGIVTHRPLDKLDRDSRAG